MCGITQPFGILVFVDRQGDWFTSLDSVIFAHHLSATRACPTPSSLLLRHIFFFQDKRSKCGHDIIVIGGRGYVIFGIRVYTTDCVTFPYT
ncbi:uncharacterized protein LACBIDRAFT_308855 [Laccaria bicolor S238N-H82]|uniref:Predicted protein n=1 Tax=Laccaria bicolor (strain S238N-H82 / ATCC MYA-4686) TaxID=486041 RepID=B0CXD0_LACBS|nr:uncharacterized protein LACBIDRAFT_308855 [Laccaria bicolor S238N-H82]EDR13238.1 predicted protein [Laccaria bicolor S238N-H82]|eukprot:XP_001875736.1 predicted protein [Laccaria bicolor S238N-H82]